MIDMKKPIYKHFKGRKRLKKKKHFLIWRYVIFKKTLECFEDLSFKPVQESLIEALSQMHPYDIRPITEIREIHRGNGRINFEIIVKPEIVKVFPK